MDDQVISVHFAEIALKGKNRSAFEKALVDNIRKALGDNVKKIERMEGRLLLKSPDTDSALSRLSKVFGIAWFSPSITTKTDMASIREALIRVAEPLKGKTIKVETRRSDKSYPQKSPEVSREMGMTLEEEGHATVLKDPEERMLIEILKDCAIVSQDRHSGPGGLPVGTGGPVLSLLSGGIDSPVASWLMMRRGCTVDYLHVHSGADSSEVLRSKMPRIVQALQAYHPKKCRLFIAPYTEFYKKSLEMEPRSELVVFRRFMIRLANRIAQENRHLGIVTGDNLGQVASQTLWNMHATSSASLLPIYRPLLTYDKQEIIDLSKKAGLYEMSVEKYKDCCSLVAMKHPATRVKLKDAEAIEKKIGIDEIVERTLDQVEIAEF